MIFDIESIAKPVIKILKKQPEDYKVHSVFKNAINLYDGNSMITIQTKIVQKTPMVITQGINTDLRTLNIRPNQKVYINTSSISIAGSHFNFCEAKIWNPALQIPMALKKETAEIAFDKISRVISGFGTLDGLGNAILLFTAENQKTYKNTQKTKDNYARENFIKGNSIKGNSILDKILDKTTSGKDEDLNLLTRQALKILTDASIFLINYKPENASESLIKLIGLGTGLTPSGDDFLTGLLSLLQVTHRADIQYLQTRFFNELKDKIIHNLDKTNVISAQFLRSASEGDFSESFHTLLKQIANEDYEKVFAESVRFLKLGHSSGTDALSGILFGLYFIKNEIL